MTQFDMNWIDYSDWDTSELEDYAIQLAKDIKLGHKFKPLLDKINALIAERRIQEGKC